MKEGNQNCRRNEEARININGFVSRSMELQTKLSDDV